MSQNPDNHPRPAIPAADACAHVRAKVDELKAERDRGADPLLVSRFFPPFSR